MTSFITDAMVDAALTADMQERAGVDWREALDPHEQECEKRIMRSSLEAAMKAAWRPETVKPDDGQPGLIQAYGRGVCFAVHEEGEGWRAGSAYFDLDRSWMPLPPAPEDKP